MTMIGGFQSDLVLDRQSLEGNIPAAHTLGGYGNALGDGFQYALSLDPPLTAYAEGLSISFQVDRANVGAVTLNIDGLGALALVKMDTDLVLDLAADDLLPGVIYQASYDGTRFQVDVNPKVILPEATDQVSGTIQLATQSETNLGLESAKALTPATLKNHLLTRQAGYVDPGLVALATIEEALAGLEANKAITPAILKQFMADTLIGLWKNQGVLDASGNPDYPAAQAGDAYTISQEGRVGGNGGPLVQPRDVVYCLEDNPGGSEGAVGEMWGILQANLDEATFTTPGMLRRSSNNEALIGLDVVAAVNPKQVKDSIRATVASTTQRGAVMLATESDVMTGVDNTKAVTSLYLEAKLDDALIDNSKYAGTLIPDVQDPAYPVGLPGWVYYIGREGMIGGLSGIPVKEGDWLYCLVGMPRNSGSQYKDRWRVINRYLEDSTEEVPGIVSLATQAETLAGLIGTKAVTPLHLKAAMSAFRNRSQTVALEDAKLNAGFSFVDTGNLLAILNDNTVILQNVHIQPLNAGTYDWATGILALPKPLSLGGFAQRMVTSLEGQQFIVRLGSSGNLVINGTFLSNTDQLILDLGPYVAQYPLVFAPDLRGQ